jgi:predicted Co/Zn/Cd cation transporter (cation efflux family)
MTDYQLIPQFLIVLVVAVLLLCLVAWWKSRRTHGNSSADSYDPTAWLLLGLLTVAIFALGAFAMFVLLRFGG